MSSSNTRSVLPGNGIGTSDESITARAKIPAPPRRISQSTKNEEECPCISRLLLTMGALAHCLAILQVKGGIHQRDV